MNAIPTTALSIIAAALLALTGPAGAQQPKSGYEYLTAESREMQDDDFMNPGMAWVEEGEEIFGTAGKNGKSCASCHGDGGAKLDPARIATYPVYDSASKAPMTLQQRIHTCWKALGNRPLKYDSPQALKLEVFVRHLARGQKVNVDIDGPLKPFYEKGRQIFHARAGQLDMACTLCHDLYAGRKIRANTLSQGQSNGYPAYRLKNGRINGLHGRINGCYKQFRAAKMPPGNPEYVNLEVYVNARGNGLPIETPGIRF